jgi:azurin
MRFFGRKSLLGILFLGVSSTACSISPNTTSDTLQSTGNARKQSSGSTKFENQTTRKQSGQVIVSSGTEKNTGAVGSIKFKLNVASGDRLLDVDALRIARSEGHSDSKIIEEASKQNLILSDAALSFIGLSKYILRQYGAQEVEGVLAMGLAAVERARAAGLKDPEIVAYSKLQGIKFGEQALVSLALNNFVLMPYGASEVEGVLAMGLAAVERARAAGLTDSDIIAYSKLQGIKFGEQALVSLGLNQYVLKTHGAQDVNGVLAMGLAAVERARAAGVMDSEIIAYSKLQGIKFGEQALVSLGLNQYVLRTYGAQEVNGVLSMGLAAVDRAKAAGLSHADIKAYAKLQGIFFGERALEVLGN